MDLSDIESWTRELVVSEARRRGIREPELRATSVLVRLILRDQYGGRINAQRKRLGARLEQARALVDSVVGALPEALVALRGHEPSMRSPSAAPPAPPPRPAARARPAAVSEPEPASSAPPVASQVALEAASHVASAPTPAPSSAAPSASPKPSRRKAKPAAARARADEPAPADTADAVPETQPAETQPGSVAETQPGTIAADDAIVCEGDAQGARVRWATSAQGRERASTVLGEPGQLALRVIDIAPDPEHTVRTRIDDALLDAPAGERALPPPPEGARRLVAVGLKGAHRFVSIAHARA